MGSCLLDKISIIVPIYNVCLYLSKCLDSIIGQTYTSLEIILIDDGSDDGSAAICDEYVAKDSRVMVIHQKNAGVSAARNAGLERCSGKYFMFVDADDWLEPQICELLKSALENSMADLAVCNYRTVYENSQNNYVDRFENNLIKGKDEIERLIKDIIGKNHSIYFNHYPAVLTYPFCKLCRTDKFAERRFPVSLKYSEDIPFMIEILRDCKSIMLCDFIGYNYLQRKSSMTCAYYHDYSKNFTAFAKLIRVFIKNYYDKDIFWSAYYRGLALIAYYGIFNYFILGTRASKYVIRKMEFERFFLDNNYAVAINQYWYKLRIDKALILLCAKFKLYIVSALLISIYEALKKVRAKLKNCMKNEKRFKISECL